MSTEQRENLDAILRQTAFPPDSEVDQQRRLLKELLSAQPLPGASFWVALGANVAARAFVSLTTGVPMVSPRVAAFLARYLVAR